MENQLDKHFFVFSYKTTNFGDCLTKIFFEKISNKQITISKNKSVDHFMSVGSIIGKATKNSIIMGTGAMKNYTVIKGFKKILWVRGPLTRNNILNSNFECPEKYGDPFILFPLIYKNCNILKSFDVGFIPHTNDKHQKNYNLLVNKISKNKQVLEININIRNKNYQDFINKILSCDLIIASSLHAVIISLVYKKKTIYTRFGGHVSKYKFEDFFQSLKINYKMLEYNDDNLLSNIINIDYKELKNIGISMINLIPFINNERKKILINEWVNYCD